MRRSTFSKSRVPPPSRSGDGVLAARLVLIRGGRARDRRDAGDGVSSRNESRAREYPLAHNLSARRFQQGRNRAVRRRARIRDGRRALSPYGRRSDADDSRRFDRRRLIRFRDADLSAAVRNFRGARPRCFSLGLSGRGALHLAYRGRRCFGDGLRPRRAGAAQSFAARTALRLATNPHDRCVDAVADRRGSARARTLARATARTLGDARTEPRCSGTERSSRRADRPKRIDYRRSPVACSSSNEVLSCTDVELDERVDKPACRRLNIRSMIVVPIVLDGAVCGVLKVASDRRNAFSEHDVLNLTAPAGCGRPARGCVS